MKMRPAIRKLPLTLLILSVLLIIFHQNLLRSAGDWLVQTEPLTRADAALVLNTGVEIYARLREAAALYRDGIVTRVVLNGNRKVDELRALEQQGYQPLLPWYAENAHILRFLGVAPEDIIAISAEDAYDTVSEADSVGKQLITRGIGSVIVTTSKFHTRRAGFIWRDLYGQQLRIQTAAARNDPYDPARWWRSGRQIRWVMAEYGAWLFYYWKTGLF